MPLDKTVLNVSIQGDVCKILFSVHRPVRRRDSADAYFGVVTDVDFVRVARNRGVVADNRAVDHDVGHLCACADDGVPYDGIGNDCLFADGGVWSDDGVLDARAVGNEHRLVDDAAGVWFCGDCFPEKDLVGGKQGFGFAAVVPAVDGEDRERFSAFDHQLQGVGELVLALGLDLMVDEMFDGAEKRSGFLQVVEAHDGEVADRSIGFFDQLPDAASFGDCNAESAGIVHLPDSEGGDGALYDGLKIDVEDGVAEDDEQRVLFFDEGLAHPDGVGEAEPFGLVDEGELDVIVFFQPLLDHVAEIADDDDGLIDSCCDELVHDMADNGLARDVEQHFRVGEGMRAEA